MGYGKLIKSMIKPRIRFSMLVNDIPHNTELSDAAVRLYWFYHTINPNNGSVGNKYVEKILGWSQSKVIRAKKELIKADLVYMDRVSARIYDMYLSNGTESAKGMKYKSELNCKK